MTDPQSLSHLHGLFRARWFARRDAAPIPLFCPRLVIDVLRMLEVDDADAVERVFDWHELPAATHEVGHSSSTASIFRTSSPTQGSG